MMTALVCALICAVLLLVDFITKTFAHAYNVFSDYFLGLVRLDYEPNYGMMLGIANTSPGWVMDFVTVLTGFMIVGIGVLFFTTFKRNKPARYCLAFIEAGAIGNFVDRVCLGYVRDFISIKKVWFIPGYICNVADIYIMVGAIVLIFIILFIGKSAVFPLTKKWRAEAKIEDEHRAAAKKEKAARKAEKRNQKK